MLECCSHNAKIIHGIRVGDLPPRPVAALNKSSVVTSAPDYAQPVQLGENRICVFFS